MESSECKYNASSEYQKNPGSRARCAHIDSPHPGGFRCSLEHGDNCVLMTKATHEQQHARDAARV